MINSTQLALILTEQDQIYAKIMDGDKEIIEKMKRCLIDMIENGYDDDFILKLCFQELRNIVKEIFTEKINDN